MTRLLAPRTFALESRRWTVVRRTTSSSRHETGLQFVHDRETRFLVFTRGAMPSESELQTMSEEVLRVLLERAEAR